MLAGTREVCKSCEGKLWYNCSCSRQHSWSTHDQEELELSKALSKVSTVAAMYMPDYTLPQLAKLSKTIQTQHLDLIIPSLVDSTICALGDTVYQLQAGCLSC